MMKPVLPLLLTLVGCSGTDHAADVDAGADAGVDPCATTVTARPGTVITTHGPVTGSPPVDGVWSWKGIPYAAPPTADLRWRAPAPPACWTEERATTAFGAMCPQLDSNGVVVGEEDCLTLNVWAPDGATDAPTMVFIHGGGNTLGSTSDPLYDGAALAKKTGAVVVTLEYRLGALGYFANPALDAESEHHVSGNYGILDQIEALKWVKTNIAGFGGSSAHVLLFGESAGGQNTLIHVASPLSAGLFSAAVAESGGSYRDTLADNETAHQQVVTAAACTTASDVASCMRAAPATVLAAIPTAASPIASGLHYTPSIDGYVIPDYVPTVIAQGQHNKVPLVVGTNADETSRMVPQVTTDTAYRAAVISMYGTAGGNALLALYPSTSYASPQKALIRVTTDVMWTCPMRTLARAASEHQTPPVFRYRFQWSAPGVGGALIGATHGIELPFVFGNFAGFTTFTPSASDLALSTAIEGYWSRFAGSGDPNGGSALMWSPYTSATDPYLALDTTISMDAGLATSQCDAIDALSR